MQSFADNIEPAQHKDHSRYFTKQEYAQINDLMIKIRDGDAYASDELIKVIKPFMDRISKKLALKILGEDNINDEIINDAVNNALVRLLAGNSSSNIFSGPQKGWGYLQTRIQNTLVDEFKKIQEAQQEEFVGSSPDSSYRNGKHIALDRDASNPETELQEKEVRTALQGVLSNVSERKKYILEGVLDDETQANIGKELGVCKQRVSQIKKDALNDLRKPFPRNKPLKSAHLGDENPISR